MKITKFITVFVYLLFISTVFGLPNPQKLSDKNVKFFDKKPEIVSERILVRIKKGSDTNKLDNFLKQDKDISKTDSYKNLNIRKITLKDKNLYSKKVKLFKDSGFFDLVGIDATNSAIALPLPNDTYISYQWDLTNIDVFNGWTITNGYTNIIIGIVDSGIDYYNPDLTNCLYFDKVDKTYGYTSYPALTNGGYDDFGHGTHVAGTIAAQVNNGIGVAGIAPNVKLMSFKFLDAAGYGTDSDFATLVDKIISLRNRGVNIKVLNNSWGGEGYDPFLEYLFKTLEDNGVLSIVAAGNSSANIDDSPFSPGSLPIDSMITVDASDTQNNRAGFSNYGLTRTHISAPGTAIVSTMLTNGPLSSTAGYGSMNGTSMACPHVVALAGLVLSVNPNLKPIEVKSIILNKLSYDPLSIFFSSTGGKINVFKTLKNPYIHSGLTNYPPKIDVGVTNFVALGGSKFNYSFTAQDKNNDKLRYFTFSPNNNTYLQTNNVTFDVPNYSKNTVYSFNSVVFDDNGGADLVKNYLNVLVNTNFVLPKFDLDFSAKRGNMMGDYNVYITACLTNGSDPLVKWSFDVFLSLNNGWNLYQGGDQTATNCQTAQFALLYNELFMAEARARNQYGQTLPPKRFYFNPYPTDTPTNKFPHLVINVDKDTGVAPLTVNWDLSSSYDEDGNIDAIWAQGYNGSFYYWYYIPPGSSGQNVYDTPGRYTLEFLIRDNNGGMDYNTKEINVLLEPQNLTIKLVNNNIILTYPTFIGQTYQFQYKNKINDNKWISLGTNILASGTSISYSEKIAGSSRFYRVVRLN